MIKKILFISLLALTCVGFSQEKPITKLSAAPNPFTTSTKISFHLNKKGLVFFKVKNVLGKTVYKEQTKALKGKNLIVFYKQDLLPGIYIYTIQSIESAVSKRLVIK